MRMRCTLNRVRGRAGGVKVRVRIRDADALYPQPERDPANSAMPRMLESAMRMRCTLNPIRDQPVRFALGMLESAMRMRCTLNTRPDRYPERLPGG